MQGTLLKMAPRLISALLVGAALFAGDHAQAQDAAGEAPAPSETLFRDVRVFDGSGAPLSERTNVLVRGNLIAEIGPGATPSDGARVVNACGRTLMPGLIDAHWHSSSAIVTLQDALTGDAA